MMHKKALSFDAHHNHSRCLAHVINLAVKAAIQLIKSHENGEPSCQEYDTLEDEEMEDEELLDDLVDMEIASEEEGHELAVG